MEYQLTFADSEFSSKRRQTRKEIFLSRMDALLPWSMLLALIEPVYPKVGNVRQLYPLQTMFRLLCLQHWYNLSDGAMEDALYEIASMRLFTRNAKCLIIEWATNQNIKLSCLYRAQKRLGKVRTSS